MRGPAGVTALAEENEPSDGGERLTGDPIESISSSHHSSAASRVPKWTAEGGTHLDARPALASASWGVVNGAHKRRQASTSARRSRSMCVARPGRTQVAAWQSTRSSMRKRISRSSSRGQRAQRVVEEEALQTNEMDRLAVVREHLPCMCGA